MVSTAKRKRWKPSWRRISLAPLLRALGFEYLNALTREWVKDRGASERPKIITTKSRWTALARNAIHIFPMTALSCLIAINFQRIYIGPTFSINGERDAAALALIQVGAKVIELFCVASLTTIVLHVMRYQLLGDGLPLGLLGSGIWFSSIAAFWSPNFLGAFSWKRTRPRYHSRWWFYAILIVCGLIAATVAPASAILTTPRMQNFSAGGASFYLPGTSQDFTPAQLLDSLELDVCRSANATEYAVCPSGGFNSLLEVARKFTYSNYCPTVGTSWSPTCQAKGAADWGREWLTFVVESSRSMLPPVLSAVRLYYGTQMTVVVSPHATTTMFAQDVLKRWNEAAVLVNDRRRAQYRWTYELAAEGSGVHPYVRVQCSGPQNLSSTATDALFPYLVENKADNTFSFIKDDQNKPAESYKSATIVPLNRSRSNTLRAQWVSLPAETFGLPWLTTNGLLIELPWQNDSRAAVGCSVASTWHEVNMHSLRSNAYGAWNLPLYEPELNFEPVDAKSVQTPIYLDDSWLKLLIGSDLANATPAGGLNRLEQLLDAIGLSQLPSDRRTKVQRILSNGTCTVGMMDASWSDTALWHDDSCNKGEWRLLIQALTGMLVANGISRAGSHKAFDVYPNLKDWKAKDIQAFNTSDVLYGALADSYKASNTAPSRWVNIWVVGYAWNANTTSDYLAVLVASVYLATAGCFMLYTLIRNSATSNAWDSITELLVLCQNSEPPASGNDKLQNTSAGIQHLSTYQAIVKVRAMPPGHGSDKQRVQLVVEGDPITKASPIGSNSTSVKHIEMVSKTNDDPDATHEKAQLVRSSPLQIYLRPPSAQQHELVPLGERVVPDREYV